MKLDILPELGELDNDTAEAMLNLADGRLVQGAKLLMKSMYDFDFETPEGIERFLSLLPVMDAEIIKDVMMEIWPGYPAEIDARRHRLEIRGYLKDYLDQHEQDAALESGDDAEIGSGPDEAISAAPTDQQEGVEQPPVDADVPE
jgi:hypothetical protein